MPERIEPCPCGSGKLYKDCCGNPLAKVVDLDRWRWQKYSQGLRFALSRFTEEDFLEDARNKAFYEYFGDLEIQDIEDLDENIWNEFVEWFIFDYPAENDRNLVTVFLEKHREELEQEEIRLLNSWASARISLYQVNAVGDHKLDLIDLLRGGQFVVEGIDEEGDDVNRGDLLVTRLLMVHRHFELASGAMILPPRLKGNMLKKIYRHYCQTYRLKKEPKTWDWDDFLWRKGYQLTYLADELYHDAGPHNGFGGWTADDPSLDDDLGEILKQFLEAQALEDYYREWLERPQPDLNNISPREAAFTEKGRRQLKTVLSEVEKHEQNQVEKGELAYPVARLKLKLGLLPGTRHTWGEYKWSAEVYAEIARLVEKTMLEKKFLPGQIAGALKIWFDFSSLKRPKIKKPQGWAAGVTYTQAHLDLAEATQQEIAAWYGVSSGTVSANYRKIQAQLDLQEFDSRYSTEQSPLAELEYLMELVNRRKS